MYKRIITDLSYESDNGVICTPIVTLADEYGGRCQIGIDDHCYVLRLIQPDGRFKTTPYIFREAFDVLRTLPLPPK